MRDDRLWLEDILEAIGKIEADLPSDQDSFVGDEKTRIWVLHFLQRIGEAARVLSDRTRNEIHEVDWQRWVGFRNVLVHQYFEIDDEVLWRVSNLELPKLKAAVFAWLEGNHEP